MKSTSRRAQDVYVSLKTLLTLLMGFYLGGLHSSFYVTTPSHDEFHRGTTGNVNNSHNGDAATTGSHHHDHHRHPGARSFAVTTTTRDNTSSRWWETERQKHRAALQSLQVDLQHCQVEKQRAAAQQDNEAIARNVPVAAAAAGGQAASDTTNDGSSSQQQQRLHPTIPKRTSGNPLCQRFPYLAKESALSIWLQHVPAIHKASQLQKNDVRYHYGDFTAQLLEVVTPRLPRSVLNLPLDWKVVDRILHKIDARYRYLQQQQQPAGGSGESIPVVPPPVKILVMGGSVLIGRNCRKLNKDLGLQFLLPNRECTYAHRLQKFLDLIAGQEDLFDVTKIAMGGTNTAVGSQVFLYDLVPDEAWNPDIVINAYATNDMHVLTALEAATGNQTLGQRVFEMTQDFVRSVMEEKPCRDKPLLIHMDDYLGNEQREILSTMELSRAIGSLADYYGFNRISYANLVRDIVYGDTRESWFSPGGWWPSPRSKTMEREIHPGMGMHIVTQWVIAYDLLTMATTFCSIEGYWHESPIEQYKDTKFSEFLPLRGDYSNIPGKPKSPPAGLPPKLTPSLNLEFVSQQWRAADAASRQKMSSMPTCDKAPRSRCIFSWVSGLSQQQNDLNWVEERFRTRVKVSRGWKLVDEGGKKGYMPTKIGDKMVLEFRNLSQPIESVTFFIMKSYGEKWKGSRLSVSVSEKDNEAAADWTILSERDMVGEHAKNTSETYPETMTLTHAVQLGSSLRVAYELSGGTTFKIMGLAVCS